MTTVVRQRAYAHRKSIAVAAALMVARPTYAVSPRSSSPVERRRGRASVHETILVVLFMRSNEQPLTWLTRAGPLWLVLLVGGTLDDFT
jgi:hypothetical protein